MRVLVTGGSGFIGTNLVSWLRLNSTVLSTDISPPMNADHSHVHKRLDVMDKVNLESVFRSFQPTHVVHLAAETKLDEKHGNEKYRVNVEGVHNVLSAATQTPSVKRCVFASTKLVCKTDYSPKTDEDYCPDTLYGESKVEGELLVRRADVREFSWCIVRPTSIWGPWSVAPHIPYGRFFRLIAKGWYFHPGSQDPQRYFGYAENTVCQIAALLRASIAQVQGKTFYLADYEPITIRVWADLISAKLRGRSVRQLPEALVRALAYAGDVAKLCGVAEPPLSSIRLRNMRANTAIVPLDNLAAITGPLPFSLEDGVERTILWLREYGYIS